MLSLYMKNYEGNVESDTSNGILKFNQSLPVSNLLLPNVIWLLCSRDILNKNILLFSLLTTEVTINFKMFLSIVEHLIVCKFYGILIVHANWIRSSRRTYYFVHLSQNPNSFHWRETKRSVFRFAVGSRFWTLFLEIPRHWWWTKHEDIGTCENVVF